MSNANPSARLPGRNAMPLRQRFYTVVAATALVAVMGTMVAVTGMVRIKEDLDHAREARNQTVEYLADTGLTDAERATAGELARRIDAALEDAVESARQVTTIVTVVTLTGLFCVLVLAVQVARTIPPGRPPVDSDPDSDSDGADGADGADGGGGPPSVKRPSDVIPLN